MLAWLLDNEAVINLVLQALLLLVWVVYLQLFLLGFIWTRQSVILIHIAASRGPNGRCLVTNMGAQPIYLLGIVMQQRNGSEEVLTPVTDREELTAEDFTQPAEATNQGPLATGEFRDIGDFHALERRAGNHMEKGGFSKFPEEITLYIVATSGHKARLVGCCQTFVLSEDGDQPEYRAKTINARQINNFNRPQWAHVIRAIG